MLLGRVVGTATSTIKHESLDAWKLLIVQPFAPDGRTVDGDPQLAIDPFGAGPGATVILSGDGLATRELIGRDDSPARWHVMGVRD